VLCGILFGVQHAFDDPSTGHLKLWNGKEWRNLYESLSGVVSDDPF
jgi:hypothetical protein